MAHGGVRGLNERNRFSIGSNRQATMNVGSCGEGATKREMEKVKKYFISCHSIWIAETIHIRAVKNVKWKNTKETSFVCWRENESPFSMGCNDSRETSKAYLD